MEKTRSVLVSHQLGHGVSQNADITFYRSTQKVKQIQIQDNIPVGYY